MLYFCLTWPVIKFILAWNCAFVLLPNKPCTLLLLHLSKHYCQVWNTIKYAYKGLILKIQTAFNFLDSKHLLYYVFSLLLVCVSHLWKLSWENNSSYRFKLPSNKREPLTISLLKKSTPFDSSVQSNGNILNIVRKLESEYRVSLAQEPNSGNMTALGFEPLTFYSVT